MSKGCRKLVHLEALDLRCMQWGCSHIYISEKRVPYDAAFVTCLDYLKDLKTLVTELGGRVIMVRKSGFFFKCILQHLVRFQAYQELHQKRKTPGGAPKLKLQSLHESHFQANMVKDIRRICPGKTSRLNR